jgi:alkanesulfonate monooxygenase SsuD/methylene tetrahydromethanopterin reductase-like flavin-dependent oxidoreductase (luciferase family)
VRCMAEQLSAEAQWPRFDGVGLWLEAPHRGDRPDRILERATTAAAAAEHLGLRMLWVSEWPSEPTSTSGAGTGGRPAGAPYEAYSLLGALAVRTERVRLGVMGGSPTRREPSILAKIVTGVDVISHGRGVLTLDGDGRDPSGLDGLDEALTVCRLVLEGTHPTFAGRIHSIDGAINRPLPVQPGGVPLVVVVRGDGPGRQGVLTIAVRSADALVVDGGADGVRDALAAADEGGRGGVAGRGAVEVIGLCGPELHGVDAAGSVAEIRRSGATGCVIGLPYPWEPTVLEDRAATW